MRNEPFQLDEKVARFQLEHGLGNVAATCDLKRSSNEISQSVGQVADIVNEFLLGDPNGEADPSYFTSVHSNEDVGLNCCWLGHHRSLVKSEIRVASAA